MSFIFMLSWPLRILLLNIFLLASKNSCCCAQFWALFPPLRCTVYLHSQLYFLLGIKASASISWMLFSFSNLTDLPAFLSFADVMFWTLSRPFTSLVGFSCIFALVFGGLQNFVLTSFQYWFAFCIIMQLSFAALLHCKGIFISIHDLKQEIITLRKKWL